MMGRITGLKRSIMTEYDLQLTSIGCFYDEVSSEECSPISVKTVCTGTAL